MSFKILKKWQNDKRFKELTLAINISPNEFRQKDFIDNLRAKMISIADVAGMMNAVEVIGKMSDEEFLKHTMAYMDKKGNISLDYMDVILGKHELKARTY